MHNLFTLLWLCTNKRICLFFCSFLILELWVVKKNIYTQVFSVVFEPEIKNKEDQRVVVMEKGRCCEMISISHQCFRTENVNAKGEKRNSERGVVVIHFATLFLSEAFYSEDWMQRDFIMYSCKRLEQRKGIYYIISFQTIS